MDNTNITLKVHLQLLAASGGEYASVYEEKIWEAPKNDSFKFFTTDAIDVCLKAYDKMRTELDNKYSDKQLILPGLEESIRTRVMQRCPKPEE